MSRKINVKLILKLQKAGLSRNMIAGTRHMSKNSVGDVIHIADKRGSTYDDVSSLDEDAACRMFYPDKHAVETLYRQPDYEYVHKELKRKHKGTGLSSCPGSAAVEQQVSRSAPGGCL